MLEKYLKERLSSRSVLLMTHAVAGYPSLDDNWRMLECMAAAGVSLVELQMPFSEPIADGPVFVRANQAALARGLHWDEYFDFMARATQAFAFPVLYMGYYNSVFCMGHDNFCHRVRDAGGQGYIIADLPPEQARELDTQALEMGLDPIHLMTPTNTNQRLREIAANASGFVYCVARKGVTGRRTRLDRSIIDYLGRCQDATTLPIALGFGIKTPEDVRSLKDQADIAIVGTAALETWEVQGEQAYLELLTSLAAAGNPA